MRSRGRGRREPWSAAHAGYGAARSCADLTLREHVHQDLLEGRVLDLEVDHGEAGDRAGDHVVHGSVVHLEDGVTFFMGNDLAAQRVETRALDRRAEAKRDLLLRARVT